MSRYLKAIYLSDVRAGDVIVYGIDQRVSITVSNIIPPFHLDNPYPQHYMVVTPVGDIIAIPQTKVVYLMSEVPWS